MNLVEFQAALEGHHEHYVNFLLPSGEPVPYHFHVTEVGKVTKDFVDCGGTRRSVVSCRLQTWVADDTDHRLDANKLSQILTKAAGLGLDGEMAVEVEAQRETVGIFAVERFSVEEERLVFQLSATQTACLAQEKCGLEILTADGECCEGSDCC